MSKSVSSNSLSRRKFISTSVGTAIAVATLGSMKHSSLSAEELIAQGEMPESVISSVDVISPYGRPQKKVEGKVADELSELVLSSSEATQAQKMIQQRGRRRGDKSLSQKMTPSVFEKKNEYLDRLHNLMSMDGDGIHYTDFTTQNQIEGVWTEKNEATVIWTRKYTYQIGGDKDKDAPKISFGTDSHMTRLVKDGGNWLIDFNDPTFGVGAMPGSGEPNFEERNREMGLYSSSDIEGREAFNSAEYNSLYNLEPVGSGEDLNHRLYTPFVVGDSASTRKKGVIGDSTKRQKLAGSYNRNDAANYARSYGDSPNTDYITADNDCTNFVSQCLKAGGWKKDYGWYKSRTNAWWYVGPSNLIEWSWTWANADYLHDYITASGRGSHLGNIWDLWKGDVLLYDWQNDNYQDHAAICRYRSSSGNLYMAQHTSNYSWKPLVDIVAGASNSWRYFAFRISSTG